MTASDVALTLPADARFVHVARLVAVAVAAGEGWTFEDGEDVRLAVDELLTIMLDCGACGPTIEMMLSPRAGAMTTTLVSPFDGEDDEVPVPGEVAHLILRATMDEHSIGSTAPTSSLAWSSDPRCPSETIVGRPVLTAGISCRGQGSMRSRHRPAARPAVRGAPHAVDPS